MPNPGHQKARGIAAELFEVANRFAGLPLGSLLWVPIPGLRCVRLSATAPHFSGSRLVLGMAFLKPLLGTPWARLFFSRGRFGEGSRPKPSGCED